MWKRVLAAEAQEEAQEENPNCIGKPTDPITAIHEEEEEQASKEESTDGLNEREEVPAIEEEEIFPQLDTSGEKEEEPEWNDELWPPLKPGIWTLSKTFLGFFVFLS